MAKKKAEKEEVEKEPVKEAAKKPARRATKKSAAKAEAPARQEAKPAAKEASEATGNEQDYAVLLSPVITEKSSLVGGDGSRVVFRVHRRADKLVIKNAIERIFKVKVVSVRTCNYQGKLKRTARSIGRRAGFKKAYVTLAEGQTINVVEGL